MHLIFILREINIICILQRRKWSLRKRKLFAEDHTANKSQNEDRHLGQASRLSQERRNKFGGREAEPVLGGGVRDPRVMGVSGVQPGLPSAEDRVGRPDGEGLRESRRATRRERPGERTQMWGPRGCQLPCPLGRGVRGDSCTDRKSTNDLSLVSGLTVSLQPPPPAPEA